MLRVVVMQIQVYWFLEGLVTSDMEPLSSIEKAPYMYCLLCSQLIFRRLMYIKHWPGFIG